MPPKKGIPVTEVVYPKFTPPAAPTKEERQWYFIQALARDLLIEQCRTKGVILGDHVSMAFSSAKELGELVFALPGSDRG